MLATITIDDEKCNDPLSCRKCLLVCPMYVFGFGTTVGQRKFEEIDPRDFFLRGVRFEKCTGCMECVEVCPKNAIQVSF
jgi:NAD-dependent dihydropyrimidine dehydrogenase PreA subunit